MARLEYDTPSLHRSEEYFRGLKLPPGQTDVLEDMVAVLAEACDIEHLPAFGFVWLAVREWEGQTSNEVTSLKKMKKKDRLKHIEDIIKKAEIRISSTLRNPVDFEELEKRCDEAFKRYKSNFGGK